MYLSFSEEFDLPISTIFPYFKSPSDWAKLYGVVKPTKALDDEWYAVPLKMFPFPLMAKNVEYHDGKKVRWIFGGFWRGVGEVNFSTKNNKQLWKDLSTLHLMEPGCFRHFLKKILWKKILKKYGI